MSVDDWKKLVDIISLLSLLLAFILGVASWRIGTVISRRDDDVRQRMEASLVEAKSGLAKQEERAALAEKATEEIKQENLKRDEQLAGSQKTVALLQKDAADSKAAQQNVELELGKQRELTANAQAGAASATEKAANAEAELLALREQLAPRRLQVRMNNEELELFSGTKVLIVYVPGDSEVQNLVNDIATMLERNPRVVGAHLGAGWNIIGIEAVRPEVMAPAHADISAGVQMLTRYHLNESALDTPSMRAARVLAWQLTDQGIDARVQTPTSGPAWPAHLADDAVLVMVGRKPAKYWKDSLTVTLDKDPNKPPTAEEEARMAEHSKWVAEIAKETDAREKVDRRRIVEEQRRMRAAEQQHK